MNTLRFKKVGAATLSSALVLTTLTPMTMTADAATKVQSLSIAKIKNGKLVYKNSGKVVKGYARYNGKIYKNGLKFTGLLNKYYYKAGVKGTAQYKGKYYVRGSLANGVYNNKYYKSGLKSTGLAKDGRYYYRGSPANSKYGKYMYVNGYKLTGLKDNKYYSKGVLGSGTYKGYYYRNGSKFSGLTSKGTYYKDGVLGTGKFGKYTYDKGKKLTGLDAKGVYYFNGMIGSGEYKNVLYKDGNKFSGVTDKDLYYKNGVLATGLVGDVYYTNGKRDAGKTAELKYNHAKKNFKETKESFDLTTKQLEELKAIAEKAESLSTFNSGKMRASGNPEVQKFIDQYKNFEFLLMTDEERQIFDIQLAINVGATYSELQDTGNKLAKSFEELATRINDLKDRASAEQKQEFVKIYQDAASLTSVLKEAGVNTDAVEKSLEKLEASLPEIKESNSFSEVVTYVESLKWEDDDNGFELQRRIKPLIDAKKGDVAVSYDASELSLKIALKSGSNNKTITLEATDAVKAKKLVHALFLDPNQSQLANDVTTEKIAAAKDQVNKMNAGEAKDNLLAKVTSAEKMLKDQVDAKAALKGLYATDGTTLLDTVVQKNLDDTKILLERVTNPTVRTDLFAQLEKTQKALDAEIEKLNKNYLENGSLAVQGSFENIDEVFKFQMANIALENGELKYFLVNKSEAKKLNSSDVSNALKLIISKKSANKESQAELKVDSSKRHGFTIFKVDASSINTQDYATLDGDHNNSYLISLNNVEGKRVHKIKFENDGSKTTAEFVTPETTNYDSTIDTARKRVDALLDENGDAAVGVTFEQVLDVTSLVNTIKKVGNEQNPIATQLKAKMAKALEQTRALNILQTNINKVNDKTDKATLDEYAKQVKDFYPNLKPQLKTANLDSYKALADAQEATAGTFKLASNITITKPVILNGNVVLDGNKNSIAVKTTAKTASVSGIGLTKNATLQNVTVQGQGSTPWADNLVEVYGTDTKATIENVIIIDGYQAGLLVQKYSHLTVKKSLTLENNLWGGGEIDSTATLTFASGATFSYTPAVETPPFWIDAMVEDAKNIIGADSFLNAPKSGQGKNNNQTFYTLKTQ